jgi:hypothetical protein
MGLSKALLPQINPLHSLLQVLAGFPAQNARPGQGPNAIFHILNALAAAGPGWLPCPNCTAWQGPNGIFHILNALAAAVSGWLP